MGKWARKEKKGKGNILSILKKGGKRSSRGDLAWGGRKKNAPKKRKGE